MVSHTDLINQTMEITDYEITPFLFTEENVIQKLNEMSVECRLTLLELIHLTFRKEDEDEEPVVECKEDERTTFKNMAYALLGEETCVPMSLKYARCLKWTTYMCPYESQVRKMLEMDNFYLPCDLELTKDS